MTSAEGDVTGPSDISEDAIFEGFATGSGNQISSSEISAHALFPCVIVTNSSENALIGRIDGLFVVFGLGLVKGDTLTDSSQSPALVHDVFGNTWRSEPVDFYAIRRE